MLYQGIPPKMAEIIGAFKIRETHEHELSTESVGFAINYQLSLRFCVEKDTKYTKPSFDKITAK